jgi:hypothetical protein
MGATIMKSAFDKLQYSKAQLLLAEQRKDDAGVQEWRRLVAYWQNVYEAEKQANLVA